MDLKKKIKGFFTLTRKANSGFTLVELIVVIAILAILGGVAVPAYSGYVTKANKSADQQLISDVAHALSLGYYGGVFAEGEGGYVILSSNGAQGNNDAVNKAMVAAFGEDWNAAGNDALSLKHDGWLGLSTDADFSEAYQKSSYNGNEDVLITQIGSLTNTLKDVLGSSPSLVGPSFNKFLTDNNIKVSDKQAVSNAAVLYAASTINGLDETKTAAVNTAFDNFYNPQSSASGDMLILTNALRSELGTYGAVAALYAHGEAFGQYVSSNGNASLLEDFHKIDTSGITDTDKALDQVAANLGSMVQKAKTDATINPFAVSYIADGQYADDVSAYLEAMKKIDDNSAKFTDKLGNANCYTDGTAAALLHAAIVAGSLEVECEDSEVAIWIDGSGVAGNSIDGIQG